MWSPQPVDGLRDRPKSCVRLSLKQLGRYRGFHGLYRDAVGRTIADSKGPTGAGWGSPLAQAALSALHRHPGLTELEEHEPPLWFGKKAGGLGIAPLTWQGRAAISLYCFLVVVAVFTYSQLTLTVFVVVFYTVTFGLLVVYKSDLLDNWPPGSGPHGDANPTDRG
jgi:hypothetical protein